MIVKKLYKIFTIQEPMLEWIKLKGTVGVI